LKTQTDLFLFDSAYHVQSFPFAGVDEAGRGPLAGPVTAAAVIFPNDFYHKDINDSKKLSAKTREELSKIIKKESIAYSIVSIDNNVIDEINILQASLLAMKKAVLGLNTKPTLCLIDGNKKIPDFDTAQETIIRGDAKSASIAAASILAKVERDKIMIDFSIKFPNYSFEKHKGYATQEHIAAIRKYGICVIHRKTFSPIPQILERR
jgi:ribonuclease HII